MLNPLLAEIIRYLRYPAGAVALVGFLLSLATHIMAVGGIDFEPRWPDVWLLHLGIFPLVAFAIVTATVVSGRRKQLSFGEFLSLIPLTSRVLVGLGLVYAVATFVIVVPASGSGDLVAKDGRYFFNNHGSIREVTEKEFHFERCRSLRLYSALWLYVYLLSAVYLLGARRTQEPAIQP